MMHSFDVRIACEYGVNAAIIFQNIYFWCEHNRVNDKHLHDGMHWTYCSNKAFAELMPYLGKTQINNAIKKLIDGGLIVTGNYNDTPYDRTLWYAVTDKGFSIMRGEFFDSSKKRNGENETVQPIPDIKPDIKPDSKPDVVVPNASARAKNDNNRVAPVETAAEEPCAYDVDRSEDVYPPTDDDDSRPDYDTPEAYAASNLQVMTWGNMQELGGFAQELPGDVIRYAIDEACANGVRKWAYVRNTLQNWIDSGVRTLGDAKAACERYRRDKQAGNGSNGNMRDSGGGGDLKWL